MRVLIAEDDAVSRKILAASLRAKGYEPVETADGDSAWAAFDRSPTRLVVSDWSMPGLSGLELCRRVRSRPGTDYAYFILATATFTGENDYRRAMKEGVDDFLLKPLDGETLWLKLQVAERILGLTRRVRQLESFLPICSYCRRVRDGGGSYWNIEEYLEKATHSQLTHGICADCERAHFPAEAGPGDPERP